MLKSLKPIVLAFSVIIVAVFGLSQIAAAQSQSKCYFQPGGVGFVAASGCTITVESGGALNVDSGATVSMPGLSSLSALTVTGATKLNGGLTMDTNAFSVADASGNTAISGTLVVTGGTDFNGAMNVDANVDADSFSTAGNSDLTTINNSAGDITINDNTDITGTLQFGADNLYPLGYASVNQQIVCGTTVVFTGTETIQPTGLTTVTYPVAIQITQPVSTAVFLTASAPTTSTFVLSSWDATYGTGTTGVQAHWCAVGDQ